MTKPLSTLIAVAAIATLCNATAVDPSKLFNVNGIADVPTNIADLTRICVGRTGVSPFSVEKIERGDFSVKDKRIECYVKCFFDEAGFLNAKGEFLDDVVIDKLSENADKDKVEALVNTCKMEVGKHPCETAYKMYQCYMKHKYL